jgi:hypothetical protein
MVSSIPEAEKIKGNILRGKKLPAMNRWSPGALFILYVNCSAAVNVLLPVLPVMAVFYTI